MGSAGKILDTQRLYLREMGRGDFGALCKILQDEEAMYAYEGGFQRRPGMGVAGPADRPL